MNIIKIGRGYGLTLNGVEMFKTKTKKEAFATFEKHKKAFEIIFERMKANDLIKSQKK